MLEEKARVGARLRRLRRTAAIRDIVRETRVHVSNLIAPVFVTEGERVVEPVESMPGVHRYSVDRVSNYVGELMDLGIKGIMLFGIPDSKDELGTEAYSGDGVVPRATRQLRKRFPALVIAADVCLCEYTSHGHCGVVENGTIDNDRTLPLLAKAALQYARAGADFLCPSAMMDGQVLALRRILDESGFDDKIVMGYSAKFASSFYGPFRDAAGSTPSFGDRKAYQMSPPNAREALREIASDIEEGADIIMVKPALAYLDVISRARSRFDLPLAAYNVSGEYSMIKAASMNGWLDEKSTVMEVLGSIKRAGADIIITYFAEQFASWVREET